MIRKQVMLTPDLDYRLKALAQQKKVSDSFVVREALVQYMYGNNSQAKKTKKVKINNGFTLLLEMAKKAEKSKQSGPTDLSTNDMYLYGPESEV